MKRPNKISIMHSSSSLISINRTYRVTFWYRKYTYEMDKWLKKYPKRKQGKCFFLFKFIKDNSIIWDIPGKICVPMPALQFRNSYKRLVLLHDKLIWLCELSDTIWKYLYNIYLGCIADIRYLKESNLFLFYICLSKLCYKANTNTFYITTFSS